MKLPFSFGKKGKPEYFLALLLREEKATAVVFEELSGKVRVIGEDENHFKTSIEDAQLGEWLEILDKTISAAEIGLPAHIETKKTIFGVKEEWVLENKIKKEYLVILKKISDELGLTPIGFLVITEAIIRLVEKEEGVPLSAILIEIGKESLSTSLIRAGRIIESRKTKIEDSIPKTVDRMLHHFTTYEILPARIILSGLWENESLLQEFIKHSWSKSLPFLHVPKASVVPKGFDARAVLFGASIQMGFEMLDSEIPLQASTQENEDEKIEAQEESEEKPSAHVSFEELGFVKNADILNTVVDKKESEQEEPPFAVQTQQPIEENHAKSPLVVLAFAKSFLSRIPKPYIFLVPVFLVLMLALGLWYILGVQATVVLDVKPKVVEQDQEIQFRTNEQTNFAKNTLAAKLFTVSTDADASTATTGKKDIGTAAKGSVTLFSRLPQSKTFEQGLTIKDPHGIEFTLDKSTTVASSSADASAEPTKTAVSVTAKIIGKEANLPSGTKFTLSTFDPSDVIAKNDTAFSGGTKKEVSVVSQKDLDTLTANVTKDLEQKAREKSKEKLKEEEAIFPIFVDSHVDKKDFDKRLGDEASLLKIKATISYEWLSYKKTEAAHIAKSSIEKQIPSEMVLSQNGLSYEIKNPSSTEKKFAKAALHAKARLIPNIKNDAVRSQIAGKSVGAAKEILTKSGQVTNVTISLNPKIPFLPQILPRILGNILITIHDND